MKFGFLFGAGAEVGYNLPLGSKFALDIFRFDNSKSKEEFKERREKVDSITSYANDWMPKDYREKSVSAFGKKVFQSIIKDTIEHNRNSIILKLNDFDSLAQKHIIKMKEDNKDVVSVIETTLNKKMKDIILSSSIRYIGEFQDGDKLFGSNYFSSLLLLYMKKDFWSSLIKRKEFGNMILSIMQLQLGALSENLTKRINEGVFSKKEVEIDLFDDLGDIVHLNYSETGLIGLEYLLDMRESKTNTPEGIIIRFIQLIIEDIYASVLDYKSLIDSNWYYLYNPRYEWAKFTKICIFLMTVREYILSKASNKIDNSNGYYNVLKESIDSKLFEVSEIATTNYNTFIEEILGENVTYLNGSTDLWYDPYINKIGKESEILDDENHIIVPLMFTQSGTKPMTAINMSEKYVKTYKKWKKADALVVVGFGFGSDDEHINGMIRTLVDDDDKRLIVITLHDQSKSESEKAEELGKKLKVKNNDNIQVIYVDNDGISTADKRIWSECLVDLTP